MMPVHLHFADKYNDCMDKMLAIEERKMECEYQLRGIQAQASVDTEAERMKKVRLQMIEEEWMVADDTLTLLQGCADLASMGQLAKAWQMWEDAENDQRGCSKTKEMKRREKAAEANLKTKREADQAMYLTM